MTTRMRVSVWGLLGLLAVLTGCPWSTPDVRVDLSARVGCGPGGGPTVDAEVRAEPPTTLLVDVVYGGRVVASRLVDVGTSPTELQLVPAYPRDTPPRRVLAEAVARARARDGASRRLLAETPIGPLRRPCY